MTTQLTTTDPAAEPRRPARRRLKRLVLGRPSDPRWARPALWAVLILAAVLYSWDLSRNGDANAFYAAAVLSGTESWKAFFYGSLDSASFITVDKPPFAFWVMGISARIFGFNSWSLLLPQAAEGVAAVAVVYAAVRRSVASLTGERGAYVAALIAALALTLTPMVVAIDRDDNPDTMLTLLLALGAWALLESLRAGRVRPEGQSGHEGRGHPLLWLILSAAAFGLAFNTKMLEGFIALPALPIVYLIASDARLRTRLGRLSIAGGVLAVITLSWMTIVDLIPKTSRPYVGSSANDTVWNLAVGYNGFGRISGGAGGFGGGAARTAGSGPVTSPAPVAGGGGSGTPGGAGTGGGGTGGTGGGVASEFAHRAGGAGGAGGFGGQAGIGRMFASTLGGQISWLIPFAVIALIATLVLIGRRPRIDLARASVLVWGGWFACEFVVLSFQQGTQHPYYTSAMAPPIAALTGIGAVALYQAYRRTHWWSLVLPAAIAITGGWAFVLLRRTPAWNPWLPWTIAGATIVAVLALALGWLGSRPSGQTQDGAATASRPRRFLTAGRPGRLFAVAGVVGLIAIFAGPAAFSATPLSQTIAGSNPLAGPTAGGGLGGFGLGGAGLAGFGGTDAARGGAGTGGYRDGGYGAGGYRDGGYGAGRTGTDGRASADGRAEAERPGGAVGLGAAGTADKQMIAYLEAHRDGATWLVAVQGSSSAASIILATGGIPVMAMGGFRGTDAAPTLAQFEQYVKQGKVHYVLAGVRGGLGGGGFGGGSAGTVASVTSWVEQNCTAVPASAYGGAASGGSATSGAAGTAAGVAQALYHCG
jgi:4-amino-4-deoxy-L-arabinose transferase-like glycosyltransferase